MTRFSDIPVPMFPMNEKRYSRLYNEVGSIAARFSDLGTPEGSAVAKKMEKALAALVDAWELIRALERREDRAEEVAIL